MTYITRKYGNNNYYTFIVVYYIKCFARCGLPYWFGTRTLCGNFFANNRYCYRENNFRLPERYHAPLAGEFGNGILAYLFNVHLPNTVANKGEGLVGCNCATKGRGWLAATVHIKCLQLTTFE